MCLRRALSLLRRHPLQAEVTVSANFIFSLCISKCLTIFNKIAIQATAQMVVDKEAVGLSRVHVYESRCIMPLRDNCLFCSVRWLPC